MKILLIHNYYGSSAPSGENKVFEAEKAMLEKHGHEVEVYTRHSDEIRGTGNGEWGLVRKLWGKVKGAVCTVGNPFAARDVARICRDFKPDVVHFHNVFPLISPLGIRAASKYAPVVLTLHNYRTACAAGVPTRNGGVCSLCLDKRCVWDGIKHRCYRGSLFATLPLAVNISLYRRLLPRWVSRFIVFSEFQKQKMMAYGFPEEKITIKVNFIKTDNTKTLSIVKKNQILYVGRLGREKGVATLIKAFKLLSGNMKLVIVGDGDERAVLEQLAANSDVEFAGQRNHEEVERLMRDSKAMALPSEWWEGMPMTLLEGISNATPAVVSNLGAMPEMIDNGRLGEVFEAGNAGALAAAIKRLLSRPDYDEMCAEARRVAKMMYSEEANYEQLMKIYESVKYA